MLIFPVKFIYITQEYSPEHGGIDFGGREEDLILAAKEGAVEKISYQENGYGNYIILKHDNNYKTLYAHLIKPSHCKIGQRVEKGEVIGYMGSTGRSTGNHLHFELRNEKNKPINPIPYFEAIENTLKNKKVRKTIPALNIRAEPSLNSEVLFTLYSDNLDFEVLEETYQWTKVKINLEAWMFKNYLKLSK